MFSGGLDFDPKPLTVATLSLFNQRTQPKVTTAQNKSWTGDWLFRRSRLELVDRALRAGRPDIVLFQESMARVQSESESDSAILLAGAVRDYAWDSLVSKTYPETQEEQSLAVAVSPPYITLGNESWFKNNGEPPTADTTPPIERLVNVENDGMMGVFRIDNGEQTSLLVNVQMPKTSMSSRLWFGMLEDRIRAELRSGFSCAERIIIAGYMPVEGDIRRYSEFLRRLNLKDVSTGFCQVSSRCMTATPANDLFLVTSGDDAPSQADRIIVHQSALVLSSSRAFEESDASDRYSKQFGMSRLWPSQRFGWAASVRFAQCPQL